MDLFIELLHVKYSAAVEGNLIAGPRGWHIRLRCWSQPTWRRRGLYDALIQPPLGSKEIGWASSKIQVGRKAAIQAAFNEIERELQRRDDIAYWRLSVRGTAEYQRWLRDWMVR